MVRKRKIEYVSDRFCVGYLDYWIDAEEFSAKLQDAIEKAKQFTNGLEKPRITVEYELDWGYYNSVDNVEIYVQARGQKRNA